MSTPVEPEFNIERHLIPFLQDCPFFAELSRQLPKVPTSRIPTASVAYDKKYDQVTLFYNPKFFEELSNSEVRGILTHEFYHLVFGHLTARVKKPSRMWNIATDLAINSIIVENSSRSRATTGDGEGRPLPRSALIPGQWSYVVEVKGETRIERELTPEEKTAAKLGALIASFPKMKASEWYFNELMKAAKEERDKNPGSGEGEGDEEGDGGFGSGSGGDDDFDNLFGPLDDHESWEDLPEEQREYIAGKVKAMVEKAVRHADSMSTGWGNIPMELRDDIRKSVSNVINWRSVLRQFIGNLMRGGRTTSIKRINRRYPYIHPGIKRGYTAKLLIARDESGSVSNEMLEAFYSELRSLTKKVEIDFVPFDCDINEKDVIRWTKGTSPDSASKRTRGGGTDFNAPTRLFNDPKNRGRWDGLLIMTDGMAPQPEGCRGRRGWILAEGCKLEFQSDELQVFVTPDKPIEGAWR